MRPCGFPAEKNEGTPPRQSQRSFFQAGSSCCGLAVQVQHRRRRLRGRLEGVALLGPCCARRGRGRWQLLALAARSRAALGRSQRLVGRDQAQARQTRQRRQCACAFRPAGHHLRQRRAHLASAPRRGDCTKCSAQLRVACLLASSDLSSALSQGPPSVRRTQAAGTVAHNQAGARHSGGGGAPVDHHRTERV